MRKVLLLLLVVLFAAAKAEENNDLSIDAVSLESSLPEKDENKKVEEKEKSNRLGDIVSIQATVQPAPQNTTKAPSTRHRFRARRVVRWFWGGRRRRSVRRHRRSRRKNRRRSKRRSKRHSTRRSRRRRRRRRGKR